MIGKPKYKIGDKVSFNMGDTTLNGEIIIVDRFGVFEDDSDVHYDILASGDTKYIEETNPSGECIYKHIRENMVF